MDSQKDIDARIADAKVGAFEGFDDVRVLPDALPEDEHFPDEYDDSVPAVHKPAEHLGALALGSNVVVTPETNSEDPLWDPPRHVKKFAKDIFGGIVSKLEIRESEVDVITGMIVDQQIVRSARRTSGHRMAMPIETFGKVFSMYLRGVPLAEIAKEFGVKYYEVAGKPVVVKDELVDRGVIKNAEELLEKLSVLRGVDVKVPESGRPTPPIEQYPMIDIKKIKIDKESVLNKEQVASILIQKLKIPENHYRHLLSLIDPTNIDQVRQGATSAEVQAVLRLRRRLAERTGPISGLDIQPRVKQEFIRRLIGGEINETDLPIHMGDIHMVMPLPARVQTMTNNQRNHQLVLSFTDVLDQFARAVYSYDSK